MSDLRVENGDTATVAGPPSPREGDADGGRQHGDGSRGQETPVVPAQTVPAAEDPRSAAEAFLATATWTRPEPPPDTLITVRVRPSAVTVTTLGRAWRALAEAVAGLIENRRRLWALEAGAGEKPLFELPEDAFIVGVNKDLHSLEANTRLDQRIPVDLAEFEPAAAGFDLITSWYGLEELADPADVLDKFARWAGPGGLIVLAVPNLLSPRSLLARARGRTRLRRCLTPTALRNRFDEHGFTPVFQVYFEDSDQTALRRRFRLTRGWWTAAQGLVRAASLGFVDAARTDYLVIFRRDE